MMEIKVKPMGVYQTNCYVVSQGGKELIIDPGVGATNWVVKQCKNPIAILNTHGHFDHVWSNAEVKKRFNIPIYCPKGDVMMLSKDPLHQGVPASKADVIVKENARLNIGGIDVVFHHYPGHTPGCSVIEIGDTWFSGDFLFERSIGRWDFPMSSGKDMVKSLQKVLHVKKNFTLYPGHGNSTTLKAEQQVIPYWIEQVKGTL
jgi:glyoxylase-like metal-dependent hydrolase (beta-lactamase superfamily II)